MNRIVANLMVALSGLCLMPMCEAQELQMTTGEQGVETLAYRGVALIDLKAQKGDAFAVGSYKLGGKAGWGGTDYKPTWDAETGTLTWTWAWGSVACGFKLDAARATVRLTIAVSNRSQEVLDAINIYALGLQFGQLPKGFGAPNYPQFRNGLDGPAAVLAAYDKASAVAFVHKEATPLYVGLSPSGPANHYRLQVGSWNDDSEGFLSRAVPVSRPVAPRQTDKFTIEMRFGAGDSDLTKLAGDVLKQYATAWPMTLQWKDRRPIGELFLTDPTPKARSEKLPNPRNYNIIKGQDVHTAEGKSAFKGALLAYADKAVERLKSMNAQGAIVWDLEGQQFPQPDASFIGDPSAIGKLAPEMDAAADEFFRKFTSAGLRCGVTVRPQRLEMSGATPKQQETARELAAETLVSKMRYAKERWGCTLFYVDSDGGPSDATAASVFAEVNRKLPDVLVIPENIWTKDYAYAAPLASFTAPYKPLYTPSLARAVWPRAFTVTYVGDAPGHSLKGDPGQWKAFQEAVGRGDILAFRAWFDDQPLNSQVVELYKHRKAP